MKERIYYLDIAKAIVIVGTSVLFWVARLIKRNRILEYIGRNSMVFYLFHFNMLLLLVYPTVPYISSPRGPHTGLYGVCLYALFLCNHNRYMRFG